jgi:hypothetical protein
MVAGLRDHHAAIRVTHRDSRVGLRRDGALRYRDVIRERERRILWKARAYLGSFDIRAEIIAELNELLQRAGLLN